MAETARNFVGSYRLERAADDGSVSGRAAAAAKEAARNFPFLVFDGKDPEAGLRCVACQICEKECPPQCIYIEKSKDKKPDYVGKPQIYPAKFDIDISVCMSCQICVEVCPFEAIKMDNEFELAPTTVSAVCCWTKRTGEVERILPPDSSHRSRRGGCAACGRKSQGGSKGKGRCGCSRCKSRRPRNNSCSAPVASAKPNEGEPKP